MANSLSPMIFRKKGKGGGTRNERIRSKSMENIMDDESVKKGKLRPGATLTVGKPPQIDVASWKELDLVKSTSPVIACILPGMSMDFVCSALMAVGATPLITEGERSIAHPASHTSIQCTSWRSICS